MCLLDSGELVKHTGSPFSPTTRELAASMGAITRPVLSGAAVVREVWYIRQTERAVGIQVGQDRRMVWVPKSQVLNVSEVGKLGEGEAWRIQVKTWWAKEKLGWR